MNEKVNGEKVELDARIPTDKIVKFRTEFAQEVWPKIGDASFDFAKAWTEKNEVENLDGIEILVGIQMLIGHLIQKIVPPEFQPYVVVTLINGLSKQTGLSIAPENDDDVKGAVQEALKQ